MSGFCICKLTTVCKFAGAASLALAGCATPPAPIVATTVHTVDRPVPVPCRIEWPARPEPHVARVQLSGNQAIDGLLVWRAAEAELGERIAYEALLEAAFKACEATP